VVLRRDAFFRRALAVADVVAAAAAILLFDGTIRFRSEAWLLLPVVVLAAKVLRLYDRDRHVLNKTTIDEAPGILQLAAVFTIVIWLGESFFVDGHLGRREVFGLTAFLFVLVLAGRRIARRIALRATPAERCAVLGNAGSADRIARKLRDAGSANAVVIGRVALEDGANAPRFGEVPLLGRGDSLPVLLAEHGVERVLIAPDGHDQERVLHAIRLTKALGIKVSVLPRMLEVVGSSSTFDEVEGVPLLGVRAYGLERSSERIKRLVDATAAGLGLILLAPLLCAITFALKLDSRGPVFFRQPRIGRNGKEFQILKFRSMVDRADEMKDDLRRHNEADGLFKISEDPRITRVGHWLRRTSLDELPQLLNVLKGDMSLVGPRPLVPDEDAQIGGWQRRRLALRPGMTGLWQVLGSSRIPMHEMVKIDYFYGANWSIWLDAKVLIRTVPYVFSRRGM
jgi:exopolysaccharide biosynthesis polyprenyl glycosylphosphotransferase